MKVDSFISDGDALMSLSVLSSHPVFSAFSTNDLLKLISDCTVHTYRKNEVVVQEDDLVDAVYFILEGACEVRKHAVNADNEPIELPLATLREGESIGLSEVGLFSSTGSRTASIVTLADVKVLCLDIRTFHLFLKDHPDAGEAFSNQLDMVMRMHFIKSVAPFASISNQQIRQIAEQIQETTFAPDTVIFKRGDMGNACYIVTAGEVEVSVWGGDGFKKILANLGENAIFGESALIMDAPRNATVRVIAPTTVLKIDKELFNGITHQHVNAQEALMQLQLHHCRPIKMPGIDVYTQKNVDGSEITVLRNTALGHYTQLSEQGRFLWDLLDGNATLNEVAIRYFREFHVLNVEDIASQIINLHNEGFVKLDPHEKWAPAHEASVESTGTLTKIRRVMEYCILFCKVDGWITKAFQSDIRYFYSKTGIAVSALIALVGLVSFIMHFGYAIHVLDQYSATHKWFFFLLPIFILALTIPLNKLAHAFTAKFFGHEVHTFGIGWFGFWPFIYCDTSDMWLSPTRQRVAVDLAGVYVSAVLAGIAGLGAFYAADFFPPASIVLELFAISSYVFILINLNTTFDLVGSSALADVLDKPNLRWSAIQWIKSLRSKTVAFAWNEHYKEVIYCVMTLISLVGISGFMTHVVSGYLLMGFLGITSPIIPALATLLMVAISLRSLYRDRV